MIPELRPHRIIESLERLDQPADIHIHSFLWYDMRDTPDIRSRMREPTKEYGVVATLMVGDIRHRIIISDSIADPTVVTIKVSIVEWITLRCVKWCPLTELDTQLLHQEVSRRRWTGGKTNGKKDK